MPRIPRRIVYSFFLSGVLGLSLLPSWAREKRDHSYPLSGKVLAVSPKGMHWYQIATGDKVYLLLCQRVKGFHFSLPECKVDDKPIAVGDTIGFRVDGDSAFMPDVKGAEQELRVLTKELKTIPALPPAVAAGGGQSSNATERGIVIGDGFHVAGDKHVSWSINPSSAGPQAPQVNLHGPVVATSAPVGAIGPVMANPSTPVIATGPVMVSPVTGGAPVMVTPTAPVSGGMVTGIPTTGGVPVMGMATAPVMGIPVGGAPMAAGGAPTGGGGGGPAWAHMLHVEAGKNTYTLECTGKSCAVDKKQIELGDVLAIRTEKNWAFVTFATGAATKEQRFRILTKAEAGSPTDSK